MSRAMIVLYGAKAKAQAHAWVDGAPAGTRLTFQSPARTMPQNDRMWAMLTDIAKQVPWHGLHLTPDDWKLIMLDGLKREMRLVPNMDNSGFVNLGRSSSELSKDEFSELIELIAMFGAKHGVRFFDATGEITDDDKTS
jgi:hypothetical protein